MRLAFLAIAWMIGIVLADMFAPGMRLCGALAGIGAVVMLPGWSNRRLRLWSGCLLCAACAGLRYEMAQVPTTPHSVWLLADRGQVIIEGTIQVEPQHTEEGQQVILQTQAARIDSWHTPVEGRVLLNLPPYPAYHYGQQLRVWGRVKLPPTAERPGEFDYRAYLARRRIFALMQTPLVQVRPGSHGHPVLQTLAAWRSHCQGVLWRLLPEPQASLAGGVLLGLKGAIPDEVRHSFAVTGTAHILVVSGWHLSVVAMTLATITTHMRLRPAASFWVLLGVIWIYALFVGATPSVLRAASMASLTLLARTSGRQAEPWTLLLLACFGLTLLDPQTLWDIGFQLSVLATASLFAFAQPIEQWLQRCPALRAPALVWVRAALTATLSAQVLALPIIIYYFGSVSMVAPLTNVLLAPVLPFAMLLGTLALISGLIWLTLGQFVAMSAWLAFAWLSEVTRRLAELPWAEVRLPAFPLWLLIGYYLVMGWYVYRVRGEDGRLKVEG